MKACKNFFGKVFCFIILLLFLGMAYLFPADLKIYNSDCEGR